VANYPSAKKRIRQTERRTARNKHVRSTVRTYIKRVRQAIDDGKAAEAQAALLVAESEIQRAVAKGVYHRETGSRYISRLATQVAALGA
jgi:small subunit ribosomal protein S20